MRHPEADTTPITVERSDTIDAAAALAFMARGYRQQATLRRNAGPNMKQHRQWLRSTANVFDAAARRMQTAADEAMRS
jgi:hypothetical protein